MNPHFYSLLIQGFLSGYDSPCDLKLSFYVLPILLNKDSREKLKTANRKSRIETLSESKLEIFEPKISGKCRLVNFLESYDFLKEYCKESIIILYSEEKISIENNKIILNKRIDYKDYKGNIKGWIRCSYYLGVVFSKTTEDDLSIFLGVDI